MSPAKPRQPMISKRIHVCFATSAVAVVSTLYVVLACATPAAPPEAAPSSVACAKDTDCKGDRICQQGDCITPR